MNKGEPQYYCCFEYIVVSTHACTYNLVAAPVCFVQRMYGESYSDINTPSPADVGRIAGTGVEVIAAAEAKQA